MSDGSERSGFYVSGALHAALLGMILVGFSQAPKFEDATESIPVDTITPSQFNEIMHGERDAKPAKTPPAPPQRQLAAVDPTPPTPPEPPADLRRVDDTPPPPPARPAPAPPTPPVKPPPPKPAAEEAPTPPVKPPLPRPPKAVADEAPTPPVKPPPPRPPKPAAEEAPEPPAKPKLAEKPPEKPKEPAPEKPKADQVAKLIAKEKSEPTTESAKEPARSSAKPYDPNAIAKMLGQTQLADASPTGATPQGLPSQHSARMSPSLSASLDAWFTEAYLGCWSPPPTMPDGAHYVADVRVVFNPDGSLSGHPVLMNPPHDPAWRAHAESAIRAVLKCNPLRVPAQYAPYFEQWKSKTIHFDPQDALG